MRRILLITLTALFLIGLPFAAYAARSSDYIEDVLDGWWDYAEDEGYIVLDSDIDELKEGIYMTYTIDLERGHYFFLAESDDDITDLDMAAFYEDDYEDGEDPFVEDLMDDNYPMLEFDLRRSETIIVELWVAEYARGEDDGLYCILFTMED